MVFFPDQIKHHVGIKLLMYGEYIYQPFVTSDLKIMEEICAELTLYISKKVYIEKTKDDCWRLYIK